MIYQKTVSTPIDLYTVTPLKTTLKVSKGLVYKVEVAFPPGNAGLLKVRIMDGGYQQWPSNPNESFCTDGFTISFDDTFLKLAAPFQFDILTINEDETYAHEVTVRIGMVSQDIYIARFLPTMAYEQMLKMIQQEQARQEAEREAEKESIISEGFTFLQEEE